jgi:type II secretory pathway pseudopilin PulG
MNNLFCPRSGRRARKAFTFIELVVAVALSIVLLRGMYTIFHSAVGLARLSEQKVVAMLEISAIFDYISADVARSPQATDDYYLKIENSDPNWSIKFQALRLDGVADKYVYVKYYRSGTDLMRAVYKTRDGDESESDEADETDDGEDGSPITVGRNVTGFGTYYFDNTKNDIDATGAWDLTATLGGADRTWAVRCDIIVDNPNAEGADLNAQTFKLILPIM